MQFAVSRREFAVSRREATVPIGKTCKNILAVSRRLRRFHDFTARCFSVFTTRWLQVFTTSVVGKSRKKSLIDDSDRVAVYRTDDADRDNQ